VAPALPPGLITAAAWRRVLAQADAQPLTSGGGIECHLADPGRADLALRFRSDLPAERARMDAAVGLPGMADLFRGPGLRLVWLELDLPELGAPVASVFAGPGTPPFGAPADPPDDAEWEAIAGLLWAGAEQAAFDGLRAALPEGAWIAYLGLLRGRERRAVLAGATPDNIPRLLDRLGWPGDRAALAPVLDCARRHTARISLGLDLTGGVGSALGVELAPFGPDCWDSLLGDPALGVSAAWREALAVWPGALPARGIVRRLNHLKLTVRPGALAGRKIYLYVGRMP
jgi:hypothetical protein